MKRPRRPLFLARIPYRRRRLRDAARLLPVFGTFLFILPVLWSPAGEGQRLLSGDVVYFFLTQALLVLVAAAFAPGLSPPARDEDD
ncbi:hypothetical protein MASR1M32_31780 [Rhodobacter sp.]